MIRAWLVVAAIAGGCAGIEPASERVTLGSLELAIPSGWQRREAAQATSAIATWTPDDNSGRRSLVVVHTPSLPAISDAGPAAVQRLLDDAVRGMPRSEFAPAAPLRSKTGLLGVAVEGTFVPPGLAERHRRLHAVLFEGTALIHVLFTTGDAGGGTEPFAVAVDSLRRKDG